MKRDMTVLSSLITLSLITSSHDLTAATVEMPPEPADVRNPAEPGDGGGPADRAETTYVNASFEAAEARKKARDRAARSDWAGAAAAFQELSEKYGDQLFKIGANRYVGVRRQVSAEIAAWPTAGVEAYEAVFGAIAADQLRSALRTADPARLAAVAERYFATSAGASALDAAAESAIERGDFATAEEWYARLLTLHPARESSGPQWRVKRALCQAWMGEPAALKALAAAPDDAAMEVRVTWGGKDRTLGRFAREMADEIQNTLSSGGSARAAKAPAVSMFGGGAERLGFFDTTAVPEARLWRASLAEPEDSSSDPEFDSTESAVHIRAVQSGRLLGSVPAFGDGKVFIADAIGVRAFAVGRSESAEWEYRVTGAPSRTTGWIGEDEPPEQFTALYADGRVYAAVMLPSGNDPTGEGESEGEDRIAAIVCLDAGDGRLIWRREVNSLGTSFEEISLDGAPILHAGRLFTVARRRKGFGFEACLLLCLEPADGRLLWSTHVGEAATGSYGYTHPTRAHPAAFGDRVFVNSNLGTVAAVSASTGSVEWLMTYSSRFADEGEAVWPTRFGQPIRSWQYQPAMVWNDAVVCAPMDLEELLILNRGDGAIVRRVRLERLFNPESILGVHGRYLYAVGGQVVCFDLERGEVKWQRPLAEGRLFGRGAVASNGVYVPTPAALLRYPLDGGGATRFHWRIEEAGNLLPLDDQIVSAGADVVSGFIAKNEAYDRLERRVRDHAEGDPSAVLALAELAFSTGDDERGLSESRAAFEIAMKARAAGDEAMIRRLFPRLMRFSELITEDPKPDATGQKGTVARERLTTADSLMRLAGGCATDAASQIEFRFVSGRLGLIREDARAAIEEYQSLVENRVIAQERVRLNNKWAPASLGGGGETILLDAEVTIGLVAEDWINRIIVKHGRQSYEPVERRAATDLAEIRDEADAAALSNLAARFPNSDVAGEALALAGKRAARSNDLETAIHCLRAALSRRDLPDRPRVIREFAKLLEKKGRLAEAERWLRRGARDYPALRFGGETETISFGELLLLFQASTPAPRDRAAVVGWPVKLGYQRVSKERASILSVFESRDGEAPLDLVLAHTGGRLEARSPSTGRAVWPKAVECVNLPILLAADDYRLHLAGANQVFALARTSGSDVWQFGVDATDRNIDPEEVESWTDHAVTATSIFCASDRGDLVCLSRADGRLNWRRAVEGGTASHIAADERFVYCAKWRGRHNVIHIFNAVNGKPERTIQCEDSRPIQALATSPDGLLLVILSRSVMAIDPKEGEAIWSVGTPRHFLVSTFVPDVDGFMIGADDRRVAKYDFRTGRRLWQTEPIGRDDRDSIWIGLAGEHLIAASRDSLLAFDAADGRHLWTAADPPEMRWQTPALTSDSVLLIAPVKGEPTGAGPAPFVADAPSQRFELTRYSLSDGRSLPLTPEGPLVTEPLGSFGGFYVRNRAILVLDGGEVIGYVGTE